MQRIKVVALVIFFRMSVIPNYSSNFFKFVPFFWASTVRRHSKSRGRLLCVKIRIGLENRSLCLQQSWLSITRKKIKKKGGTVFAQNSRFRISPGVDIGVWEVLWRDIVQVWTWWDMLLNGKGSIWLMDWAIMQYKSGSGVTSREWMDRGSLTLRRGRDSQYFV